MLDVKVGLVACDSLVGMNGGQKKDFLDATRLNDKIHLNRKQTAERAVCKCVSFHEPPPFACCCLTACFVLASRSQHRGH